MIVVGKQELSVLGISYLVYNFAILTLTMQLIGHSKRQFFLSKLALFSVQWQQFKISSGKEFHFGGWLGTFVLYVCAVPLCV